MNQTEKLKKAIADKRAKVPPAKKPEEQPKPTPILAEVVESKPKAKPGRGRPIHREFHERLPDGARFEVKYHADETRWYNHLPNVAQWQSGGD